MRVRPLLFAVTTLAACSQADVDARSVRFPPASALPVRAELPELFVGWDGRRVETPEDLRTWRAAELRALFAHYVYGEVPGAPGPVSVIRLAFIDDIIPGKATYEELEVRFGERAALHVGLFAPQGATRAPVILGLNKCGNQSLVADERVRVTTSFVNAPCAEGGASARGGSSAAWDIESIVDRGFALATFHDSDAEPDDAAHVDEGLRGTHLRPDGSRYGWATISVWAFALSRAVDALEQVPSVDARKVTVFGHSRRGKAALWAAANDLRIHAVIAHQSGTAGAALARSPVGESIQAITTLFPHWFNDVFPTFSGEEERLPIDQHQLLALLAPRPVLLTDGDADTWADPPGSRRAAEAADAAWERFGDPGLVPGADGMPSPDGTLVWRSRPGGHLVQASDWVTFLDFAARHTPR